MANKTVKVLARITARPDKIEELRSLLLDLVKETRKEKGCISYQLTKRLGVPPTILGSQTTTTMTGILHIKPTQLFARGK